MTHLEKLDYILKIIAQKKDFTYSHDIYRLNKDKLEKGELGVIINKLVLDNLIEKRNHDSPTNSKISPPFYCRLSYTGILFLENGGYATKVKNEKREKNWLKTKTLANRLNTILVLVLAFIGIYLSWESNAREKNDKIKNETISKLKLKNNSLKKQMDSLKVELKVK
jgi:hypothetical protein